MATQTLLFAILLGGILGIVGQSIRVIVGLKKLNDEAHTEGVSFNALFDAKELRISLLIGFVAGVLAAFSLNINGMTTISNEVITAVIGAGYSGTDFIEGFMKKASPLKQAVSSTSTDKKNQ